MGGANPSVAKLREDSGFYPAAELQVVGIVLKEELPGRLVFLPGVSCKQGLLLLGTPGTGERLHAAGAAFPWPSRALSVLLLAVLPSSEGRVALSGFTSALNPISGLCRVLASAKTERCPRALPKGTEGTGEGSAAVFLLLQILGRCPQRSKDAHAAEGGRSVTGSESPCLPRISDEGEFGSGADGGGDVSCISASAVQRLMLRQPAYFAAMSSETSALAFLKRRNRCSCVSDAPGLFS